MTTDRTIYKAKGGVEDLLFGEGSVSQTRNNEVVPITKLNATKLPYSGDAVTDNVVSVKAQMIADKAELQAAIDAKVDDAEVTAASIAASLVFIDDSSIADSYVIKHIDTGYLLPAYISGMIIDFKVPITNTGASTVNVNSAGVRTITKSDGTALAAGELEVNQIVTLIYNLTSTRFELQHQTVAITQALNNNSKKLVTTEYIDRLPVASRNLFINGGMSIAQRGSTFDSTTTPANNDDTYLLDQCILLSDGNNIVDVSQQSGGGVSGNADYIRLDVETVSKKFGVLKIVENKDVKSIVGGVASLSVDIRVSDITKLSDIRAVVVSWDGTADAVTSDIISVWNVEGSRPTLVANWTEENVDSDLGVTASWVRYSIANISIDTAATKNVGVFIYQNDVATNDTTGIFLDITEIQLEEGPVSTPFDCRLDELTLCERYYERHVAGNANAFFSIGSYEASPDRIDSLLTFTTEKRSASITMDTGGAFRAVVGGVVDSTVTLSLQFSSTKTVVVRVTTVSVGTTGDAGLLSANADAAAYLGFSAEL